MAGDGFDRDDGADGIPHRLEVDLATGARQDPAYDFAIAGLSVASQWEFEDGVKGRVEKVIRYEERMHGEKAIKPRIVFEIGRSWDASQFMADVRAGKLNPEGPTAFALAAELNHPRFQNGEVDDAE